LIYPKTAIEMEINSAAPSADGEGEENNPQPRTRACIDALPFNTPPAAVNMSSLDATEEAA
jgi:hypothetical protein